MIATMGFLYWIISASDFERTSSAAMGASFVFLLLCCWKICVVCLALELVGSCMVLGFSVGMEAFDELLSIKNP